jgi:hypothetical protein
MSYLPCFGSHVHMLTHFEYSTGRFYTSYFIILSHSGSCQRTSEMVGTLLYLGYYVLTPVTLSGPFFRIVMSYDSERARRFGGTYCFHLQGPRLNETRKEHGQEYEGVTCCSRVSLSFRRVCFTLLRNVTLFLNYVAVTSRKIVLSNISLRFQARWRLPVFAHSQNLSRDGS